jgi:hypothetical protein
MGPEPMTTRRGVEEGTGAGRGGKTTDDGLRTTDFETAPSPQPSPLKGEGVIAACVRPAAALNAANASSITSGPFTGTRLPTKRIRGEEEETADNRLQTSDWGISAA